MAPKNILLGVNQNDQTNFNISSNLINWNLSEAATWMDLSTNSGAFTQTVTITALDTNKTGNVRIDSIIASSPPLVPQTIYVTQDTIRSIGISDFNISKGFSLYPNPNTGEFYLEFDANVDLTEANIQLFDMLGKAVTFESSLFGVNKIKLNLNDQSEGIYFINIVIGDARISKKITVIKL